jgi:hypothetical protein
MTPLHIPMPIDDYDAVFFIRVWCVRTAEDCSAPRQQLAVKQEPSSPPGPHGTCAPTAWPSG